MNRISISVLCAVLTACGGDRLELQRESNGLSERLDNVAQKGAAAFMLPRSDQQDDIPQDPSNPMSPAKIELGRFLFHETALAEDGNNPSLTGTYSCASCHQVQAGFKAGVPQGIGEGGSGFGMNGEGRVLAAGFDPSMPDGDPNKPDIQPLTSPAVLNSAYQEAMLWNGQFGDPIGGVINNGIDPAILATVDTPKAANTRHLSGLETQAVAGLGVHRLNVDDNSILQNNTEYQRLFAAAYPDGSSDVLEDAAKAIAAFERSLLANEAPFQHWLHGDRDAMSVAELRGANLFFGDAGCVSCHTGPALSSAEGARADDVFFAVGFADFDTSQERIHGEVGDNDRKGRGGFTGKTEDDYKFKIPQLYNLADSNVFGHGASFSSIREVIEYKNTAVAQQTLATNNLDERFAPLNLSESEIDDLTAFLSNALYDANLERYVPESLPSGNCFPVNDVAAKSDLGCK